MRVKILNLQGMLGNAVRGWFSFCNWGFCLAFLKLYSSFTHFASFCILMYNYGVDYSNFISIIEAPLIFI